MSITITQTCDGCGSSRELGVGYHGQRSTIKAAADQGGWRAVQEFKHLCAACIAKAVSTAPLAPAVRCECGADGDGIGGCDKCLGAGELYTPLPPGGQSDG